jgi:hypothetical protein
LLWSLSWRELEALEEQHDAYKQAELERWAIERAQVANAWTTRKDGLPWTPEDFLPERPQTGRRKEARAAARLRAQRDQAEVTMMNARLARMRPGDTEGVPEWALRLNK